MASSSALGATHHDLAPLDDLHNLPSALLALLLAQRATSHDDLQSKAHQVNCGSSRAVRRCSL